MTKTSTKIAVHHNLMSGEPGMVPLGAMEDGSLVWIF
jgi:hypothetical protein